MTRPRETMLGETLLDMARNQKQSVLAFADCFLLGEITNICIRPTRVDLPIYP